MPSDDRLILFPPIEPHRAGMLPVDDIHTLYWEESGNPAGLPIVFLHGGPGAGATPEHRRFFDPVFYRIIIFDQRGAGRSIPFAECKQNSPLLLVDDMEKLRKHLDIEKWVLFGGSWGSTLAILYGETYPDHCYGFILRGLFLMRPCELRWFSHDVRAFLPEAFEKFSTYIPENERDDLLRAYYKRVTDTDPAIHLPAARIYSETEMAMSRLLPEKQAILPDDIDANPVALSLARMETHYFVHYAAMLGDKLFGNLAKISHLPAILIQGRYDLCCPPVTAYEISKALPYSTLVMIPDAGHASSEPGITHALIDAQEKAKSWAYLPPQEIFRAYDIRGIVDETLTVEGVYQIARAIAAETLNAQQFAVIIGRDGRLSAEKLSTALIRGLIEGGCDVFDVGAVPTPLVYFATHTLPTQSCVMLTGSHNPANYNGLKIVIAGETLSANKIQALYTRIKANDFSKGEGRYQAVDIAMPYMEKISQTISLKRPLKVIVDAGNGIAGKVAPALYRALGCEVIELFCDVDGHFPHHHPDPSVPENLRTLVEAVRVHSADVGLAFDGDGDRLGVVTNKGEIIYPDRQLMLYAKDLLLRHPEALIIYDVKCTRHLPAVITQWGGIPCLWKTGHSFIKQKLRETDALLAGEMSGHLFFKENWYGFDDGLYAGARLLSILARENHSISDVFKDLPNSMNTPELKLAITPEQGELLMASFKTAPEFERATVTLIDGVRVDFSDSFGLIRASNTTPHLVMRFEGDTENALLHIQQLFRKILHRFDASLLLPF